MSETTEREGRECSTVSSERVLNARPRSWHASLATAGCEAREKAQGPMLHPSATGKGKAGRANEREPPQASLPRPSGDGSPTGEQDPPLEEAAVVAEVSMSATRAPRSRGIGGARHRPHLTSAEHGNPVTVRWTRPATGRPTARRAQIRGGTGRPRSERRQPKGDRKARTR